MPDSPVQKVLFILNPLAGGKPKFAWEKGIRDFFKTSPHQFEIYDTTGQNDQESIRYWVNSWYPDKVVVVGGDGTLKTSGRGVDRFGHSDLRVPSRLFQWYGSGIGNACKPCRLPAHTF